MICAKCQKPKLYFPLNKVNGKHYIRKTCADCWSKSEKARLKKYGIDNAKKESIRQKNRRKTPAYKAYIKAYTERNKEKLAASSRKRQSKFNKSASKNLTDFYIRRLLKRQDKSLTEIPPVLIELKRFQLQIKRNL